MAVGPRLQKTITNKGILPNGHRVRFTFDHAILGRFGIIPVYAPHTTHDRKLLWEELALQLDPTYSWMLVGDFNMVELSANQIGGQMRLVIGKECVAWRNLKSQFN